jgi:hypothetical protein
LSKIRESARGEECQVRLVGVCTGDPATVIWSHARWETAGRGKGLKAPDIAGAYACTACDAAYDGQRRVIGMNRDDIDLAWCLGHFRSLLILCKKGLYQAPELARSTPAASGNGVRRTGQITRKSLFKEST